MTITSGFFNSDAGDRVYDAEDFNEFFDGFVNDGVFTTIGDSLAVSESSGLQIRVGSGRAWFLRSWLLNSADYFLTLDAADLTYGRIDIVAMDFDKRTTVRDNTIIIVKGTPAGSPTPPALISTEDHIQIPLAHIQVDANETIITNSEITNKRGTVDCPWITALLDHLTMEDLLIQWEDQFDDLLTLWQNQFDIWKAQIEADLDAIDTGDVLTEIASMRQRSAYRKNMLINGDFHVAQRDTGSPETGWTGGTSYSKVVDRWHFYGHNLGDLVWTIERGSRTDGRDTFKATVTTADATPASLALMIFAQELTGEMTAQLEKGSSRAKVSTISFDFKSSVTGTYICEVKDAENSWSISIPFTVSTADTWESFELTVPAESTQVITRDNTVGLRVGFCVVAGSSYQSGGSLQTTWAADTVNKRFYGQVNLGAAVDNYFEISDVQWEVGSEKSDYDRIVHDQELLEVQRFSEFHDDYYFPGTVTVEGDVANGARIIYYGRGYSARKRATVSASYASATVTGPSVRALTNMNLTGGTLENLDFPVFNMVTVALNPTEMTQGLTFSCYIEDLLWDAELYMTW